MMRRPVRVIAIALSAILAGGLAAGLSAVPAAAQSGPVGSAGCSGISCWAQLGVKLSGPGYRPDGSGPNTGYSLASVPPPPCWYTQFATAQGMLDYLNSELSSPAGAADGVPQFLAADEAAIKKEAAADNGAGAAGEWYTLTEPTPPAQDSTSCIEQAAGADDAAYYVWVAPGDPLPQAPVPPEDLAEYAFSQMTLPGPHVVPNPLNTTYVTLPTYVRAADMAPVAIMAELDGVQVTVTATPAGLAISAPGATTYENGPHGDCLPQGSTASKAVVNAAGAGQDPDCGFVFQSPSSAPVEITASETWTATWAGDGQANQALPQQPIPTAPNPPVTLQVNEIQSVNNGTG